MNQELDPGTPGMPTQRSYSQPGSSPRVRHDVEAGGQRPGRQARGAAGEGEVLWGSEASSSLAPYSVEPLRWPEGGVYKWQVLDAKGQVVESFRSKWEADGRCKELNHD